MFPKLVLFLYIGIEIYVDAEEPSSENIQVKVYVELDGRQYFV